MSRDVPMTTVAGLASSRGYAAGPAWILRAEDALAVAEHTVAADGVPREFARLKHARAQVRRDLEGLVAVLKERSGSEDVSVFECHLLLMGDETLTNETDGYVLRDRLNAEAAVRRTVDGARAKFARMNDPYFRERVRDLDDLERRLLRVLLGRGDAESFDFPEPVIVVADDLAPSDAVRFPEGKVLGFATDAGSPTSHVALLARALGLPAVTGLGDLTKRVKPGETVLLDGTDGAVTVNPDAATRAEFESRVARESARLGAVASSKRAGALADGGEVLLAANIQPGIPLAGIKASGARAIGLYRSEYLWLGHDREPAEDEQYAAYRDAAVLSSALGDPGYLTVRLLDIGGDKIVSALNAREPNPALGCRSIRYLFAHPETLRTQIRAVLRASAHGRVRMLVPLVSCIEELTRLHAEIDAVKADLAARSVPFDADLPVGTMIELPAAALNAEALARHCDFFSIGTNDLVQYALAADRGNESVSAFYQPTHPAILELVRRTIVAARKKGLSVSVCGESASDPVLGTLWVAMGADTLSVPPGYAPTLARVLARLTRRDLDGYAAAVAALDPGLPGPEAYARCRAFVEKTIPDFKDLVA